MRLYGYIWKRAEADMTHSIEVSDELFVRLQGRAKPFVHTPAMIIAMAMDAWDAADGSLPSKVDPKVYDPASPPNLTHTKVLSIVLNGAHFPPGQNYWNYLLDALIKQAAHMGKKPDEVRVLAVVNSVLGQKTDSGYRFIPEAGVSVQGQDANGAWKGIYKLATSLGSSVTVRFAWYENPKAANPGKEGQFQI
jgi:hypothetical protein